jgi:hypothetical protein
MSKGYILRADTKGMGTVYYMNVIMITEDKECAEVFPNREEAEDKMGHFKRMFFYEEPVIEIEEV